MLNIYVSKPFEGVLQSWPIEVFVCFFSSHKLHSTTTRSKGKYVHPISMLAVGHNYFFMIENVIELLNGILKT